MRTICSSILIAMAILIAVDPSLARCSTVIAQDQPDDLSASIADSQSDKQARWRLNKGDQLQLKLGQTTVASILGNKQSENTLEYAIWIKWNVVDEFAGNWELQQTVQRIVVTFSTANEKFEYDSSVDATDLGPLAGVPKSYRAILGKTSVVVLTNDGRLADKLDFTAPAIAKPKDDTDIDFTTAIGHLLFPVKELADSKQPAGNSDSETVRGSKEWTRTISTSFDDEASVALRMQPKTSAGANISSVAILPRMELSEELKSTRNVSISSQRGEGLMQFDMNSGIQSSATIQQKVEFLFKDGDRTGIQIYDFKSQLSISRIEESP